MRCSFSGAAASNLVTSLLGETFLERIHQCFVSPMVVAVGECRSLEFCLDFSLIMGFVEAGFDFGFFRENRAFEIPMHVEIRGMPNQRAVTDPERHERLGQPFFVEKFWGMSLVVKSGVPFLLDAFVGPPECLLPFVEVIVGPDCLSLSSDLIHVLPDDDVAQKIFLGPGFEDEVVIRGIDEVVRDAVVLRNQGHLLANVSVLGVDI